MQEILSYLKEKYKPLSVILYGSYANGTNTETSDLDALLIIENGTQVHDTNMICGTRLDVFIYPKIYFETVPSLDCFVQIADGRILTDTDGIGAGLMTKVRSYIDAIPKKSDAEIADELAWCRKMLTRAASKDTEGLYRRHWLLIDSLEIACDVLGFRYCGPKKSLIWLKNAHSPLFALYTRALAQFDMDSIRDWIDAVEKEVRSK